MVWSCPGLVWLWVKLMFLPLATADVCLPGEARPVGNIEGLWDPVHDPSCMVWEGGGAYTGWFSWASGHLTAAWSSARVAE